MFELKCSPELENLIGKLDDSWETGQLDQLPFPLAFSLDRLQQEDYDWDFLLKDMLHILLKYVAIIAGSDYLHTGRGANFDVNENLQKLALNMSEGHWLAIIRACAKREGNHAIPELASIFDEVEHGPLTARLILPRTNLNTQRQGILSTLLTARNRLFGHDSSPTKTEKEQATPRIRGLLRAALAIFAPLWKYDLVYVFERDTGPVSLSLRGTRDFQNTAVQGTPTSARCFLASEGQMVLPLFPMVFSDAPGKKQQPSMLDEESELYILNQYARKRTPSYSGMNGGHSKRPDMGDSLALTMDDKHVWDKRQDIELDSVFEYLINKTKDQFDDAVANKLYLRDTYIERPDVSTLFKSFLDDDNSMAMVVSGASGCGKTSAVLNLVHQLQEKQNAVMLIRALELGKDIVKPKRLERWLTATLGFKGTFSEVLKRGRSLSSGRFVLIIDGLNEYTAAGKDASLLFRAINHFLTDHEDNHGLKVLITVRADGLNAFLPGGELPPDADDEVYYKVQGRDYGEIGPLSEPEALEIMQRLQIPEDTANALVASGDDKIRSPQVLRKIAGGSIDAHDAIDMDSRNITSQFLDQQLGQNKELSNTVNELVSIMGKSKDMVLPEHVLAKKSPKLLEKLQTNNGRMLATLRDLEIVQHLETEDDEGNPNWSIALSHDTLFEALAARQLRKDLLFSQLYSFGFVAFITLLFILYQHNHTSQFQETYETYETLILWEIDLLEISAAEKDHVSEVYQIGLSNLSALFLGEARINEFQTSRLLMTVMSIMLLILLLYNLWDWIRKKRANNDARMLFYGRADEWLRTRRLLFYFLIPFGSLSITWAIFRAQDNTLSSLEASFPLIIFIGVCLFCVGPWIMFDTVRSAIKGSTLLREYVFSSKSIRKMRHDFFCLLILILTFGIGIYLLLLTPLTFLSTKNICEKIKKDVITATSSIELDVLEAYPMKALRNERLDKFVIHHMEYHCEETNSRFSAPLVSESDPESIYFLYGTIITLASVAIMTGIGMVLVPELAARKYYKPLQ